MALFNDYDYDYCKKCYFRLINVNETHAVFHGEIPQLNLDENCSAERMSNQFTKKKAQLKNLFQMCYFCFDLQFRLN